MPYLGLTGTGLVAAITISSGMGFVMFGFDNGLMGSILTADGFIDTFHLSSSMEGLITAIFQLGALLGALATTFLGSRFGRRTLAHLGTGILCAGAVLQASSFSPAQLGVGRVVAGVGLGLVAGNVAIWQSETAPSRYRGTLVGCSLSFLIIGQLIAYWMEYGISGYSGDFPWRFPMAFQSVLAILLSTLLAVMPESPRYLVMKGRVEEATQVFQALRPNEPAEEIAQEVADINQAILLEQHAQKGLRQLFFEKDQIRSRYRLALACGLNFMQDFSGSTPISYYTTYIFQTSVGMSRHLSLLMSGLLQVWFLIASMGTWYLIEKFGRRNCFMYTAGGMTVIMVLLAVMLEIDTKGTGIAAVVLIFAYQTVYTWGFMAGVWTYGPEILPLEYRSVGVGLANSTLWVFGFAVTMFVPPAITNIGWRIYIIFAAFNLSYVPIVYFFFPETSGLSLEMIDLAFMDRTKGPVKCAAELRRMVKSGQHVTLTQEISEKMTVAEEHEPGTLRWRMQPSKEVADKSTRTHA
ncbi:hypothetical protein Sste5346_006565 [Sporothrix stenoceras]|uniref:Major facilitator superfamily (MFS) profile domain-containing protein n=1 Tax=Sporothrix stenoceras TaxID=5173 RepID=A0ABR3YY23_9PEZI